MKKAPILLSTILSVFVATIGFSQSKEVASTVARNASNQGSVADFSRPIFPEDPFFVYLSDVQKMVATPMGKFLAVDEANRYYSALEKVIAEEGMDFGVAEVLNIGGQRKFNAFCSQNLLWISSYVAKFDAAVLDIEDESIRIPHAAIVAALNEDITTVFVAGQIAGMCSNILNGASDDLEGYREIVKDIRANATISMVTISGCDVRKMTFKEDVAKTLLDFEPCFGVYKDRIIIVASSPAAFDEVIQLYSKKIPSLQKDSPILKEMEKSFGYFGFYGINQVAKDFFDKLTERVEDVDKVASAGMEEIFQLQSATVSYNLDNDAMVYTPTFKATFTNRDIATNLCDRVNIGLPPMLGLGAMFAISKMPSASILGEVLPSLKITTKDSSIIAEVPIQKKSIEKLDYEKFLKEYIQLKQEMASRCEVFDCGEECDCEELEFADEEADDEADENE